MAPPPLAAPLLSPQDQEIISMIMNYTNLSSVVLSLPVLVTFLVFEEKRKSMGNLLTFFFSLSGFCLNAVRLLSWNLRYMDNSSLCTTQAMLTQFFSVSLTSFWSLITLNLFGIVVKKKEIMTPETGWWQVLFGIGVAMLLTVIPLLAGVFGKQEFFCWFENSPNGILWTRVCFVSWLILLLLGGIVLWFRILREIRQTTQRATEYLLKHQRFSKMPRARPQVARHVLFVVTFLCVAAVVIVNNLTNKGNFICWIIDASAISGIGCLVFIIVGCSRQNWDLWKTLILTKCCGRPPPAIKISDSIGTRDPKLVRAAMGASEDGDHESRYDTMSSRGQSMQSDPAHFIPGSRNATPSEADWETRSFDGRSVDARSVDSKSYDAHSVDSRR